MFKPSFYFLICLSCGGIDLIDDYVPPVLRITTPLYGKVIYKALSFSGGIFLNF